MGGHSTGYLYSSKVYIEYYKIMQNNIIQALDYRFQDKNIRERLIKYITFTYLIGFEEVDSTAKPFEKIIKDWEVSSIENVLATCFVVGENNFDKKEKYEIAKTKMLRILHEIFIKYENRTDPLSTEEQALIQKSFRVLDKFDSINPQLSDYLKFAFTFSINSFNELNIINYFERNIKKRDTDDKGIQDLIYRYFIDARPQFPKDKIEQLLSYLNGREGGVKQLAEILSRYLELKKYSDVVDYITPLIPF